MEKILVGAHKALQSEETAARMGMQTKTRSKSSMDLGRAEQRAEDKAAGLEIRKGSPVKTIRGASRGGRLSKKERETMQVAMDTIG